jgi:hypothetical protein
MQWDRLVNDYASDIVAIVRFRCADVAKRRPQLAPIPSGSAMILLPRWPIALLSFEGPSSPHPGCAPHVTHDFPARCRKAARRLFHQEDDAPLIAVEDLADFRQVGYLRIANGDVVLYDNH